MLKTVFAAVPTKMSHPDGSLYTNRETVGDYHFYESFKDETVHIAGVKSAPIALPYSINSIHNMQVLA